MHATAFDEENMVLNPPYGMTTEECEPLSVWVGLLSNGCPAVISCWKPTKEEMEEIKRTGRIWVSVMGQTMPPIAPSGFNPFKPIETDPIRVPE